MFNCLIQKAYPIIVHAFWMRHTHTIYIYIYTFQLWYVTRVKLHVQSLQYGTWFLNQAVYNKSVIWCISLLKTLSVALSCVFSHLGNFFFLQVLYDKDAKFEIIFLFTWKSSYSWNKMMATLLKLGKKNLQDGNFKKKMPPRTFNLTEEKICCFFLFFLSVCSNVSCWVLCIKNININIHKSSITTTFIL